MSVARKTGWSILKLPLLSHVFTMDVLTSLPYVPPIWGQFWSLTNPMEKSHWLEFESRNCNFVKSVPNTMEHTVFFHIRYSYCTCTKAFLHFRRHGVSLPKCFILNQDMTTNFDNISRLQNGNSSLPFEFLDANCSEISKIKLQIAVQNLNIAL